MEKNYYRVECRWKNNPKAEQFDFDTLKSAELEYAVCMGNKENAAYIRIIVVDSKDNVKDIIKEFFN